MRAAKYLFALWAGVLIYTLFSVFFGPRGLSAYRQLEKERNKQEANIENLKLLNRELDNSMNSLLYDKDTLSVYAREQGYASESEKFIRIVGLGVHQKTRTASGELVIAAEPQFTPDTTIRIIALCAGISVFICLAMFDFMRFLRER